MKKTRLIVLLGISGAFFVCYAPSPAAADPAQDGSQKQPNVDAVLGVMMAHAVKEQTDPIKQETEKLKEQVADLQGKLQAAVAQNKQAQEQEAVRVQELVNKHEALEQQEARNAKGVEELGATAEDPMRRKIILGSCAGTGAITALVFVLLF